MNQLDDNRLINRWYNKFKKFNIWWGEFYFQNKNGQRKEHGGFVQWRKEIRGGDYT